MQKKRCDLLRETQEENSVLDMDCDTYTMAFHALNYKSMQKMELNPNDVHNAFQAAL